MAEDQQAPPPLDVALEGNCDAARAPGGGLASAYLTCLCTGMRGVKEDSSKTLRFRRR